MQNCFTSGHRYPGSVHIVFTQEEVYLEDCQTTCQWMVDNNIGRCEYFTFVQLSLGIPIGTCILYDEHHADNIWPCPASLLGGYCVNGPRICKGK